MVDEKRLIAKLENWAKESRKEAGLKESALLHKVIEEVRAMAVNKEIKARIEREDVGDIAEALEKQRAKKPIEEHYEDDGEPEYVKYACPNGCGVQLYPTTHKNLAYEHAYCHKCGQRLDWDVENQEGKMKYRKKPVVIEAFHWTEVPNKAKVPEWLQDAMLDKRVKLKKLSGGFFMEIETLEGTHTAMIGDYIIKGVEGELYPCKPWIFEQTYERVEAEE